MKKHILLGLRYTFYISSLLFFDDPIKIIPACLLISVLFLESKHYSFLPLILVFYMDKLYSILLISVFFLHVLLFTFMKKNRYYSLFTYLSSILLVNVVLLIAKRYDINTLLISTISIIIYAISILCFYYYNKGKAYSIIELKSNLLHLTILLGYFMLIEMYNPNQTLLYFLYIQLFFISNYGLACIFFIFNLLFHIILTLNISTELLGYFCSSFVPPVALLSFDYSKWYSYIFIIYIILVLVIKMPTKKITIEHDYITNLFQDFKSYIHLLDIEYDKLNTLKMLKENQMEYIQDTYCKKCNENAICKYKLDKRYSFLCNAINNDNNNIYSCPHYESFYLSTDVDVRTSFLQFNALVELSNELETIYQQNIKMADYYNKFFNDISFYDYQILKVDINLASKTIFFSITLSKKKEVIKELFLKIAYKAFKEPLEIKIINNDDNILVHIYKKPRIKLDFAQRILSKGESLISGDNIYIKKEYNDSYIFALSDGMGSGQKAHEQSSEALKKISNLLAYHFSLKTILKLLENMYDLKCEYDSYATLDILSINPANQMLLLYKLGSTTSYIIHSNEFITLENRALPLKLDDINSSYELERMVGDIILLMSDGISDFLTKDELEDINYSNNSEEITNEIIFKLKKKVNNNLQDDASILVIKVI